MLSRLAIPLVATAGFVAALTSSSALAFGALDKETGAFGAVDSVASVRHVRNPRRPYGAAGTAGR
jgi:hypothetical protein